MHASQEADPAAGRKGSALKNKKPKPLNPKRSIFGIWGTRHGSILRGRGGGQERRYEQISAPAQALKLVTLRLVVFMFLLCSHVFCTTTACPKP